MLLGSVQKSFHSKKAFIIFVVLKTAVTEIKPIYCFDGSTKKLKCMATFLELDHHAKSSNKNQIVGHFSNIASKKVCGSTVLLLGFMFTLKFLKFSKSQHFKNILTRSNLEKLHECILNLLYLVNLLRKCWALTKTRARPLVLIKWILISPRIASRQILNWLLIYDNSGINICFSKLIYAITLPEKSN